MNVQHKCLFHGNNPILKFCQNSKDFVIQGSAPFRFASSANPSISASTVRSNRKRR